MDKVYDYPTTDEEVQLVIEGRAAAATGRGQKIREDARLSRGEMAHLCGISKTSLFRWEHGIAMPEGPNAAQYARVLRQIAGTVGLHG